MYDEFFSLRTKPFDLTPDPAFLFLTAGYREALVGLTYAILDRKGFVVLTGDAGTGKTTLLARMLQHLPAAKVQSSVILNPTLTPAEFLELALLGFGLPEVPASKAQRLAKLQRLVLEGQSEGKISALIIDEAHKLSPDVLEEIRLLGNLEQGDQKLLQVLLVGQSELSDLLERSDLRQLKQRIALRFTIEPLSPDEVDQYIRYRWTTAGGAEPVPFAPQAVTQIAHCSQGIPRVINAVCDNALILAFSEGSRTVGEKHVWEAAADLKFGLPGPAAPAQAAAAKEPMVLERLRLRTLERYGNGNGTKRSFFGRWTGRLSLARWKPSPESTESKRTGNHAMPWLATSVAAALILPAAITGAIFGYRWAQRLASPPTLGLQLRRQARVLTPKDTSRPRTGRMPAHAGVKTGGTEIAAQAAGPGKSEGLAARSAVPPAFGNPAVLRKSSPVSPTTRRSPAVSRPAQPAHLIPSHDSNLQGPVAAVRSRPAAPARSPTPAEQIRTVRPKSAEPAASPYRAQRVVRPPQVAASYLGPQVIHKVEPLIPAESRASIAPEVQIDVRVSIDAEGAVTDAWVTPGSGAPDLSLASAAIRAARQFRFQPARSNDRSVPSAMTLSFRFVR